MQPVLPGWNAAVLFIAYYFLVCVRAQRELLQSLKTLSVSNIQLLINKHIKS